jgi:hypothetical protein
MRTMRKAAIAVALLVALLGMSRDAAAGRFECDPDDMWNSDCGPEDVCNPGTLTCSWDCNHNPTQCEPGWTCPVGPSGCVPIN